MNLGPERPEYGASLFTEWLSAKQVIPGHNIFGASVEVQMGDDAASRYLAVGG